MKSLTAVVLDTMEDDPLSDARAKLRWAEKHVHQLKTEMALFRGKAESVTLESYIEPETGDLVAILRAIPALPPHWAQVIGDAVQDFRASLNYVTWQLGRRNLGGRDPRTTTQFPIATAPDRFNRGWVADLHPDHVTMIEALQPYNRPDLNALAILAIVSNIDKHRTINPVVTAPSEFTFVPSVGAERIKEVITIPPGIPLEVNTEAVRVKFWRGGAPPQMEVQSRYTPEIGFRTGCPVEKTLDLIGAAVTQVIRELEPVFQAIPVRMDAGHGSATPH